MSEPGDRRPTSPDLASARSWGASAREGPAPWDTARRQLYGLCFRDGGAATGPHPDTRRELSAAFSPGAGWNLAAIERERLQTRFHDDHGAPAWLATVKRR